MPSKKAIAKLKKTGIRVAHELWVFDPMGTDRLVMDAPPARYAQLLQLYTSMQSDYPPVCDGPRLAVVECLRYEVDPQTKEPKDG